MFIKWDRLRHPGRRTAALLILLLACLLRFYRLDAQSFWNDEGNSARLSERSLPLILSGTASDVHPPLYYLVLHGWQQLAGDSEFALRAVSAFFGVGLVAVTYALGGQVAGGKWQIQNPKSKIQNRTSGKWWVAGGNFHPSSFILHPSDTAAFLAAINPALIYYSQEARMYELLAFLAALSTLLLLMWLSAVGRRPSAVPWIVVAYILSLAAGLYTHYFFPAVLVVHGLVLVVKRFSESFYKAIVAWLGMVAAAWLLYLPWSGVFLRQLGARPAVRGSLLAFLLDSGRWLAFGHTIESQAAAWPLVAVGVLVVLGLWPSAAGGRPPADRHGIGFAVATWVAPIGLLVPILLMWVLGSTRPAYFKFMLISAPFFCLLIARGWFVVAASAAGGRLKSLRRTSSVGRRLSAVGGLLMAALTALILWGSGRSLANVYWNPAYFRADYRTIAGRIAREAPADAGVILDAPNQWEVFTYYHKGPQPVYPIPKGQPEAAAVDAELNEIAARHGRLYAIFWGEAERDPERLVESWLNSHAFKTSDEWVMEVRFVVYETEDGEQTTEEMGTVSDLAFGEHITLKGYRLSGQELTAGEIVQVTLFWQTKQTLSQRYKVFLHLIPESGGAMVGQQDSEPGGDLRPTTTWRPDEVVVDRHGLVVPTATPAGRYTLLLGLYDLTDPAARLPITTAAGVIDALPLATIDVLPPGE